MHPTVFHADADHRHQDDRTKAAATVKSFLSGLSRTLAPAWDSSTWSPMQADRSRSTDHADLSP